MSANVCFTRSQEWQHQINQRDFQYLTNLINACTKSLHVPSILSSTVTILTWECPFLLFFKSRLQSQPKKKKNNIIFKNLLDSRRVSKQVLPHKSVPRRFSSLFIVQNPHHKPDKGLWKCHKSVFESTSKVKHLIWTWFYNIGQTRDWICDLSMYLEPHFLGAAPRGSRGKCFAMLKSGLKEDFIHNYETNQYGNELLSSHEFALKLPWQSGMFSCKVRV